MKTPIRDIIKKIVEDSVINHEKRWEVRQPDEMARRNRTFFGDQLFSVEKHVREQSTPKNRAEYTHNTHIHVRKNNYTCIPLPIFDDWDRGGDINIPIPFVVDYGGWISISIEENIDGREYHTYKSITLTKKEAKWVWHYYNKNLLNANESTLLKTYLDCDMR